MSHGTARVLYFVLVAVSSVAVGAYSSTSTDLLVPIAIIVAMIIPEEYLRTKYLKAERWLGWVGLGLWLALYFGTTLILTASAAA